MARWPNSKRRNQSFGLRGFLLLSSAAYTPRGHPEVGPGDPMLSFVGERIENGDEVVGANQIIDPQ